MQEGNQTLQKMLRVGFLSLMLLWTGDKCAMANDWNDDNLKPGRFSLSWSGGLEYGSRQYSFDGVDKFYFAKGDTINDDEQTGVGVFVLTVQKRDIEGLKGVVQALCDKDIQTGGPETYDPPATFSVACLEGGKVVNRQGSIRKIPEKFNREIFDVPFRLAEEAWKHGAKLIKLDFTTESIEQKNGSYIISVRFINSGNHWVKFKTPDQWRGNAIGGDLGVAPYSTIGKMAPRDDWGFALAGKKLINQDDFPDGVVLLNSRQSKTLKFHAIPDNKIAKGEYEFSGLVFMRIECEGDIWNYQTQVDFRPIKSRIKFDRDYPSTPEEREQYEKTHSENMSQWPVKPGEAFPEDGLYRAVQMSAGMAIRSLQLRAFKAGDVAPTESVKMLTEYASGTELDKPAQWLWAGSAPTPVKQWSLDVIDGTQQRCEAGDVCPRSGRWLARVHSGDWKYRYDLAGIVTRKRGERMPDADDGSRHGGWEWLGV